MTPLETFMGRLLGLIVTVIAMAIVYWVKRRVRSQYGTIPSDTPVVLHSFGTTTMFSALVVLENRPFAEVLVTFAAIVTLTLMLVLTTEYWRDMMAHATARQYRQYRTCWIRSLVIGLVCCCFGVGFMLVAIWADYCGFTVLA